jgi:hypothetical protein
MKLVEEVCVLLVFTVTYNISYNFDLSRQLVG